MFLIKLYSKRFVVLDTLLIGIKIVYFPFFWLGSKCNRFLHTDLVTATSLSTCNSSRSCVADSVGFSMHTVVSWGPQDHPQLPGFTGRTHGDLHINSRWIQTKISKRRDTWSVGRPGETRRELPPSSTSWTS